MNGRDLIEKCREAWNGGDFITARACLDDGLDFQGSVDASHTADELIAALREFQGMLRHVTMRKGFFEEDGAALLHDCDTLTPGGVTRTAEFFSTRGNKTNNGIRLVFDASEPRKLMSRRALPAVSCCVAWSRTPRCETLTEEIRDEVPTSRQEKPVIAQQTCGA